MMTAHAQGRPNAADSASSRAAMYATLSAIFARELTQDGWTRLSATDTQARLRHVAADCRVEREAGSLLRSVAASRTRVPADVVGDLAVEYARLFIGPGPGLAPPYESAYAGQIQRFYGEAFSEVAAVLRDEGLEVGREFGAPPDHVAVELAIMQHLAERSPTIEAADADAARSYRKQLAFLQGHLLGWAPRWAEDVARETVSGFYREAAGLLVAFLRRDDAWLCHVIAGAEHAAR